MMNAQLEIDPALPVWAAGLRLSRELSEHFDLPESDILDRLGHMPEELLASLESPQGWSSLGFYIAMEFQLVANPYQPTIH